MDSVLDLFLGDRVYDENGKLIKRDFGIKNILAIAVVVFVGYSLMGKSLSFPTLSGKNKGKKMKGGEWGQVEAVMVMGGLGTLGAYGFAYVLGGGSWYWAPAIIFIMTIFIAAISSKPVNRWLNRKDGFAPAPR